MLTPRQSQYRIKAGDTLGAIAQTMYGRVSAWHEIARVNKLPHGDLIPIGLNLRLLPISSEKDW
jgi:nucleoid-associated protein YgaU